MQKLLLPVDGSPSAVRAAKFLVRLIGGQPGPDVHLLNVQPAILAGDISLNGSIEVASRMREHCSDGAKNSE